MANNVLPIISQVINASSSLFNLIQGYLAAPTLTPTKAGVPDITKRVSIECETYDEQLDCMASQQMIVNVTGGKSFFTDNIAPKPRVWNIKGYLKPMPYEIISSSPFLQPSLLRLVQNLETAYNSRDVIQFRPIYGIGGLVNVAMVNLKITHDPTITNMVPVQMTLQEITVLNGLTITADTGSPSGISNASAAPSSSGSVVGIYAGTL